MVNIFSYPKCGVIRGFHGVSGVWPKNHKGRSIPKERSAHATLLRPGATTPSAISLPQLERLVMRDFIGVSFHKASGKYRAQRTVDGVTRHFGYHATPEAAHQAMVDAGYGEGAREFSALVRTLSIVAGVTLAESDKVVAAISTLGLAIIPVTPAPPTVEPDVWINTVEMLALK